jgi:hypothetical protein
MIHGLNDLPRTMQRDLEGANSGRETVHDGGGLNLATGIPVKESNPFPVNGVDEFAAVINFQLVPSGRLHMNREVREHIVDFFR